MSASMSVEGVYALLTMFVLFSKKIAVPSRERNVINVIKIGKAMLRIDRIRFKLNR